jgi:hypothetical protein
MDVDWVPYSATSLVAGASCLVVGAVLTPGEADSGASLQMMMEQRDALWLAVASFYFAAAVLLTIGIPALLTLLNDRAARIGLVGAGVFVVGCLGTAGYAMLLVMLRALVLSDSLAGASMDGLVSDAGLGVFLYGWVAAFYLGELLLGIALLRARTVRRWMPALLLAHVAVLPVAAVLPQQLSAATVLLSTLAFVGLGIVANNRDAFR